MNRYSGRSSQALGTCNEFIQRVFKKVLDIFDHSVLEGHRGQVSQDYYFNIGKSKVKFPDGKHNKIPSEATDAIPYPVFWIRKEDILKHFGPEDRIRLGPAINELLRIYHFAGIVKGVAHAEGGSIRWGGDWDGDFDFTDQVFDDLVHFEEVKPASRSPTSTE